MQFTSLKTVVRAIRDLISQVSSISIAVRGTNRVYLVNSPTVTISGTVTTNTSITGQTVELQVRTDDSISSRLIIANRLQHLQRVG